MKHAALLIYSLGILLLAAAGVALLGQEGTWNTRLPRPPGTSSAPESAAPELVKTRTALRHLQALDLSSGRQAFPSSEAPALFPSARPAAVAQAPAPAQASPAVEALSARPTAAPTPVIAQAPPLVQAPAIAQAPSGVPSGEEGASALREDVPGQQVSLIYFSRDFRRAVIDGSIAREGDVLADGSRVVTIDGRSVVVRRNHRRHRLQMPTVFPGAAPRSSE
jgi:hypothetical protein